MLKYLGTTLISTYKTKAQSNTAFLIKVAVNITLISSLTAQA